MAVDRAVDIAVDNYVDYFVDDHPCVALTLGDVSPPTVAAPPAASFASKLFHVKQIRGPNREVIHTRPCFLNPPLPVNYSRNSATFGVHLRCNVAPPEVRRSAVSEAVIACASQ